METNSKQTVAAVAGPQSDQTCVCNKEVADNQWFCRLTQKVAQAGAPQARQILLCSLNCALSYCGEPRPQPHAES